MRITPRKTEVGAVVAILEDDSFDSAEKMAKAVIKAVADVLGQRAWYGYAHRFGPTDPGRMWGPFATENEVVKFHQKVGLEGDVIPYKIHPPDALVQRIEEAEQAVAETHCEECGHLKDIHRHEGAKGKVLIGCAVPSCPCTRGK